MKTEGNRYPIAARPCLDTTDPVTRSFGTERELLVARTQTSCTRTLAQCAREKLLRRLHWPLFVGAESLCTRDLSPRGVRISHGDPAPLANGGEPFLIASQCTEVIVVPLNSEARCLQHSRELVA